MSPCRLPSGEFRGIFRRRTRDGFARSGWSSARLRPRTSESIPGRGTTSRKFPGAFAGSSRTGNSGSGREIRWKPVSFPSRTTGRGVPECTCGGSSSSGFSNGASAAISIASRISSDEDKLAREFLGSLNIKSKTNFLHRPCRQGRNEFNRDRFPRIETDTRPILSYFPTVQRNFNVQRP